MNKKKNIANIEFVCLTQEQSRNVAAMEFFVSRSSVISRAISKALNIYFQIRLVANNAQTLFPSALGSIECSNLNSL